MAEIILDKSYLDAATPRQIQSLCCEHKILMPDVLFYELTTTEKTSRQRCFNKFPDTTNPVELIPNVGTLLSYELRTYRPCIPLYDRREKIVFNFHKGLSTGLVEFTEAQLEARKNQETIIEQETKDFFELAMMVAAFFPEISGVSYAALPRMIQAAKDQVASDTSTVQRIYTRLLEEYRIANPIHPDILDTNWAHFRWVQVRCLYSLDLIFRYDGRMPSSRTAKFWTTIEHDMLDSEYLTLASLCGALACNENRIIKFFKRIRPDGLCLQTKHEN